MHDEIMQRFDTNLKISLILNIDLNFTARNTNTLSDTFNIKKMCHLFLFIRSNILNNQNDNILYPYYYEVDS